MVIEITSKTYFQERENDSLPIRDHQRPSTSNKDTDSIQIIEQSEQVEIALIERWGVCFQNIYQHWSSIVSTFLGRLCGCCFERRISHEGDSIAVQLATFDNSRVKERVHGIYMTTNETNLDRTRQLLSQHPRPSQELETIHIGCAAWHNLDIICARQSTYGLIIDFNPKNAEFMKKTIELIHLCDSPDHFKREMMDYLDSLEGSERDLFFHRDQTGLPTDRIEAELLREGSWLYDEQNYRYIKEELVLKGRLIAITEDMRNVETMAEMRHCLDQHHIAIDTLYMSNICNFMDTSAARGAFVQSLRHLLAIESLFISCPKIRQASTEIILNQRVIVGRDILSSSCDLASLFEKIES